MTLIFFNCHSALLRQEKTYDHFSNEDNEEDDEDEQDEDIMLLTMSGGSSASNLSQRKHVLNGTYDIYTIIKAAPIYWSYGHPYYGLLRD